MALPSLILLPGLLCDERLFAPQMPALMKVAATRVADLTRAATIAAMAEGVLAEAPQHFALLGLSMGGAVAFEIMRRAPERVTRLALLDTQPLTDTPEARARRLELVALAEGGEFGAVAARLLPLLIHPDRLTDAPLIDSLTAMAGRVGAEAFVRQQQALLGRIDSRPSLAAIRCPTLVLAGRQDALTPPAVQEEMAALIPEATLVILPRCGHMSPLEQPTAVTRQLLAWLEA